MGDPGASRSSIAWRALGFALVWLIVAGPAPSSWLIGLPSVALATWASFQLAPPLPYNIRLAGLMRFLGYFIRESLRGGWDVAMRTMSPRMRISPGQTHYTSTLPEGLPVILFAGCVSLLPGTLSKRFEGSHLSLHLLDADESQLTEFEALENHIADMLGLDLEGAYE